MVNVEEVLSQARDSMAVKRVFGDPIERDGVTVVPVASISGGGGGGGGQDNEGSGGSGVGYGLNAQPAGVYVIKDGQVSWEPAQTALDLNKIIISSHIVAIVLLLVIRAIFVTRRK